jgi:hypothetical protein
MLPDRNNVTLCPIAIFAGCNKCPAFRVCPLKGVIGDFKPQPGPPDAKSATTTKPASAATRKRGT